MTIQASPNPSYDFLSHPPTPRVQPSELRPPTPTTRTTSRRRSSTSTVTAISAWVAGVLPGPPPPATPTAPSTFSPRPSLLGTPHSAHQHSTPFTLFPETAAPYKKARDPDLRSHSYTYTVVPLPLPPSTSATPLRSSSPNNRRGGSGSNEMKRSRFTLMRQPKGSVLETRSRSPTPSTKKGLMRFLRPRSRFRSTNTQPPSSPLSSTHARKALPLPSPSSPTTIAFRIAHQKRALYAKCGALPLPLDSEVAIMQFMDGGSRTDAEARLGGTYKDAAGVVYTDEEEAGECLPLLLVAEVGLDDTSPLSALPSALSGGSDGFAFPSDPPSPLPARNTLPAPVPHSPAQVPVASSPRALLSIPARGGGACAPGYLHAAPPLLPLPFGDGDVSLKDQLTPHMESMASGRKQRRRPAPLALHVPAKTMGFEDSFVPTVIIGAPSLSAREALVAS